MIIMSILNGAKGYREMGRFMKHHESTLVNVLGLKHGVPSHVSIRTLLMGIDISSFNKKFLSWMSDELSSPQEKWISMDGKSIRSTVKNPGNKLQNFVQVVNIFTHNSKLVIGQQTYMNNKAKEAECVRQLIKDLDKQGLYICLDALHCQKKH
jgi:predicted transposase YbfD/YdcC